jgi:EAL domain-containing protein (putative c-di-GMP-specific phosphodiesterase class I)
MVAQAVRLSNLDIDNALKNRDFEVLFQPIFDLGNGALARVETFIRWRHPTLGVLPPGAFISFFETQGRMSELTRYVLAEALSAYRAWRGPHAPGFSINLALSDLSDETFPSHFSVVTREAGFPAELITLECPMPPVDADVETVSRQLQRLGATGARLAIEVRGRANEFLNSVDPFPFAEIKTGGAAILRFARTVRGPGLSAISELLDIANKANAAITAVGVEDQASLSALRGLGFAAAQGNHLGRVGDLKTFTPARVNEVRALLGLEPLAQADLHALFRTHAPAPQAAQAAGDKAAQAAGDKSAQATEIRTEGALQSVAGTESNDALVERLAHRIARQEEATAAPGEAAAARKPARDARAAARAAAKAAAIARVKRRAADADAGGPGGADAPAAARDLQARISREFEAGTLAKAEARLERDEFDLDAPAIGAEAPDAQDAAALDSAAGERLEPATSEAAANLGAGEEAEEMSRPEVDEEADGARALAASDEGETPAAAAVEPQVRASLAVGAARAHFRPGLRVGITGPAPTPRRDAPRNSPQRDAAAPKAALRDGPALRAGPAPVPAEPAAEIPAPSEPAPAARARFGAAKGEARSALGDLERDDAAPAAAAPAAPDAAADAAPAPSRRPRKNFLNRVVFPYPTHFWPRPVRRYFRRRRAEADRRRAEAAE